MDSTILTSEGGVFFFPKYVHTFASGLGYCRHFILAFFSKNNIILDYPFSLALSDPGPFYNFESRSSTLDLRTAAAARF